MQGPLWDSSSWSSRGACGPFPQQMSCHTGMYGIFHNHIQWPRVLSQCWHNACLSVCEGFAGKCDGLSVLNDEGSEPLEWGITLEGDQFGLIIVSQGSEEGFLQLGLYFLEAGVGVLRPMWSNSPFWGGLVGVQCLSWDGARTSGGNSLLLGMTAALASSGVVSSQRCLGSFLDLGEYPSAENTPPKNVTDSCFMVHFLLLKMSPSFWAMLNRLMLFASWSLLFLSVDEHIIVYGQYSGALGYDVIHHSFRRCPGTFSVWRGHVRICTFRGGCWMLLGVMLPPSDAYWRRPCCCWPWRTWWLPMRTWAISSRVGALWFSWMIALFRSLGSRHILSLPFAFFGYIRLLTHGVGSVCLVMILCQTISANSFLISSLYSMGTFHLPCWTGGTVGSVLMSYLPFMSLMQSKLLGNRAWRSLVLSMVTDPGSM